MHINVMVIATYTAQVGEVVYSDIKYVPVTCDFNCKACILLVAKLDLPHIAFNGRLSPYNIG